MPLPRGILFDYGNTILIEDYFDWLAGIKRILTFCGDNAGLTAEQILCEWQSLNQEINTFRNQTNLEFSNPLLQRTLYESLGLGIKLSPGEMERQFWRAAQRFTPAEGIYQVMQWIRSHEIKTGIISNCPFSGDVMREDLELHGLTPYFDFIISSADYGFRKPHPRIFRIGLRKMRLEAHEVWFVGDNFDCDITGAAGSGLIPVWYNRQVQDVKREGNFYQVKDWFEFQLKLESMKDNPVAGGIND